MYLKIINKSYTLSEIASAVNGQVYGDDKVQTIGLCPLTSPTKQMLCFSKGVSIKKLEEDIPTESVSAIFISSQIKLEGKLVHNYLLVEDPQLAFMNCTELFFEKIASTGQIASSAIISPTAKLGNNVQISEHVIIGDNAEIGENTVIHPNSTIYHNVKIGHSCLIHSNVVIREYCELGNKIIIQNGTIVGADGFGYLPTATGLRNVPQLGNVIIEDFVDIGACSCIDRATSGSTRIGFSTKIDNQVQIGHNVQIGKFCIICGQTGIAGSCEIGDQVVLGGNVKIKDHIIIPSNTRLGGNSMVNQQIREAGDYSGYPAVPAKTWTRNSATLKDLAQTIKEIRDEISLLKKTNLDK